jgi:Ca2+-binding RTX toxin-like protein
MANIDGTDGVDDLDGTTGDDIINPKQSNPAFGVGDLVDGGQGYDTLLVDASAATVGITSGTFLDGGFTVFFLRSNATSPTPYFFVEEARGIQNVNLKGGSGGDILVGLNQLDTATGDQSDHIEGGAGADSIGGFAGQDVLFGDAGNDTIFGGTGDDVLWGGNDVDELHGEAGNDYFYVSLGNDDIDGGDGVDTLDFLLFNPLATGAVTVSLAQGFAKFENLADVHVFSSIEIVATGNSNDLLVGDRFNNALAGNGGIDSIHGGGGDDILLGGDDNDLVFGDDGHDDLRGGGGGDRLYGGRGNDLLEGGSGGDLLVGGVNKDTMRGNLTSGDPVSNDTFDFNDKNDSKVGGRHDVILDFNGAEGDKIDLKNIDANTNHAGNDKFAFFIGGQHFHHRPAELRYKGGLLQGDVDGDGKADFEIYLVNAPELLKGDIIR